MLIYQQFLPFVIDFQELQTDKKHNIYQRTLILIQDYQIKTEVTYPHIYLSEQQIIAIIHKQYNINAFTQIYSEQLKDSYIRQLNLIQLRISYQFWAQQNRSISIYGNIFTKLIEQLKIVSAQQFAYQADVAQITYQTRGFKLRQLESIQSSQAITFGNYLPVINSDPNQFDKLQYTAVSSGGFSVLQQQISHLNCLLTTQVLINATKNPMLIIQCNPTTNSCILQHQQLNEAISNIQAYDVQLETNILKAAHSLAQLIYTGFKQAQKAKEVIDKEIELLKKEQSIPVTDKRVLSIQKNNSIVDKKIATSAPSLIDQDESNELVNYLVQKPGQLYTHQPEISHELIVVPSAQHTLYVYPAKRNLTIYETVNLIAEFLRLQTIAESQQAQKASQYGCIKADIIANARLLNNVFIPKYILEYSQQVQQLLNMMKISQQPQLKQIIAKYARTVAQEKQKIHLQQLLQQQKIIQEDEQPGDCLICGYKFDNYKAHINSMEHIHQLSKEFDNQGKVKDVAIDLQRYEILKNELEEIRDDGILSQAQQQLCGDLDNQSDINTLSSRASNTIKELLEQWQVPIQIDLQNQILQDMSSIKYKEDQMLKRQGAMEQTLTVVGSRKSGYKRIKQASEYFCQCCADLIHGDICEDDECCDQQYKNTEKQQVNTSQNQNKAKSNWHYGYNDDPEYIQFTAMVYAILFQLNLRKINTREKQYNPVQQLSSKEYNIWQIQTQRQLDLQFSNFGDNWSEQLALLAANQDNDDFNNNDTQQQSLKINQDKLKQELNAIEIGDIPNGLEMIKLYCLWKQIPLKINDLIQEAKKEIYNKKYAKYIQFVNDNIMIILQNQKMQVPQITTKSNKVCKQIQNTKQHQIDSQKLNNVIQTLKSVDKNVIHQLFNQSTYSNKQSTQKILQQEYQQNGSQIISPIIHDNVQWSVDRWVTKQNKDNKGSQQQNDQLHVKSVSAALTTLYGGPIFYQQIGNLIWDASADVLVSASQCMENTPSGQIPINSFDIASLMICALKTRYNGKNNYKIHVKENNDINSLQKQLEILYQDSLTTSLYQTNAVE